MATEIQNGDAKVHGIRNNGSAITITGYASFTLDSAKIGSKWKLDELQDEVGFTNALIWVDGHYECDVQFMLSGASRAAAEATAVFVTPGAKITMANFAVAVLNGDWINMGDQSIDLSQKQGKLSMKLRKYVDEDQNTSLTTTVAV